MDAKTVAKRTLETGDSHSSQVLPHRLKTNNYRVKNYTFTVEVTAITIRTNLASPVIGQLDFMCLLI